MILVSIEDFERQREAKNTAYSERNKLVSFIARLYPSHLKLHPDTDKEWEDDWRNIVCIHSPAGQMTWHIHDSEMQQFEFLNRKPDPFVDDSGASSCVYDGHTTEEKYKRLAQLPMAHKATYNAEEHQAMYPFI